MKEAPLRRRPITGHPGPRFVRGPSISRRKNRGQSPILFANSRHIVGAVWSWDCKELATPQGSEGLSVYYPFALVELLDITKTDEHEERGELLLHFLDADGTRVTVRLTPVALDQLRARLGS